MFFNLEYNEILVFPIVILEIVGVCSLWIGFAVVEILIETFCCLISIGEKLVRIKFLSGSFFDGLLGFSRYFRIRQGVDYLYIYK
jgi:hypothetical protein